jgi:hypothetical protein
LGPAGAGFARCYQCELALSEAGGLLADVVAPTGYAVRGGPLAEDLRRYKSDRGDQATPAAGRLRERLAAFLADQGRAVWEAGGMTAGPRAVAVVPSGQGRPGAHPLVSLVRSCVGLPLVRLAVAAPEAHARGVNPGWVRVADRADGDGAPVLGGIDVLVVDDTWVSGGSAQSTAAALKLAGARRVAVVVLGRHVNPADPRSAAFLESVRAAAAEKKPAENFPDAVPSRRACSS